MSRHLYQPATVLSGQASQVALVVKNPPDNTEDIERHGLRLSRGSDSKESVGNVGLILGSGRSPGEGNGNPLQYSCLQNPMDRGAWWATYSPWGCKESDTTEWLTHFQETWVRSLARTPSSILAWRILPSEKPGGLYIVHRAAKSQTWLKWLSSTSDLTQCLNCWILKEGSKNTQKGLPGWHGGWESSC